MSDRAKVIVKYISIFLGGIILGTALLALAFSLPVNPENREESYRIIEKEGWYPVMPVLSQEMHTYFHSLLPGVLDDSTDAVMLRTALEATEEKPLLASMDMLGYSYYWHGYVAILRPLLYFFDYGEIRFINAILQLFLVFYLMHRIWIQKGIRYALILFTSYILLMPLAMPLSLQFSWVFYIAYGGMAVILTRQSWLEERGRLYILFMILGMLTSYIDLLTYPLYTWAIPLIWWLVVSVNGTRSWLSIKCVLATGFTWLAGYAGMWVAKWALGTIILKRDIFESALYEVFFRSGMEVSSRLGMAERLEAMYLNWKHYEYILYAIILAGWLLWFIYNSIRNGLRQNYDNAALMLIGFSSVVWYYVLANHTLGHHFFTYRIWGIGILALLICLNNSVHGEKEKVKRSIRQVILMSGMWVIIAACSLGLSFMAREDVSVLNGAADFDEIMLNEGSTLNMIFTPTFPHIKEYGIGLKSATGKGNCIISLYDGEVLKYMETIPLEKATEGAYASVSVDWKLTAGKDYRIIAVVQGIEGEVYTLVTKELQMPLNEYGEMTIDGNKAGGQPLAGLKYRYRPLSKGTLIFLTGSWMGVMACVLLIIKGVIENRQTLRMR